MTHTEFERRALSMILGGTGILIASIFMALGFNALTIGLSGTVLAFIGGMAMWRLTHEHTN